VTYEQTISDVVKVVEAFGAAIMILGGLAAFGVFGLRARRAHTIQTAYPDLRRDLSRCILLGLEVLIVADIVRTIIVAPTLQSVAVEIDGVWPWHRRQVGSRAGPEPSDDA
jgi:uncharacterized membrane protein